MESLEHIKTRLGSVKNIGKITRAMELVAATKMRKSQEIALNSRAYAITALEILRNLTQALAKSEFELPPILRVRPIKKTCVLIITSDKGLAGALNNNVLRNVEKFLAGLQTKNEHTNKLENVGMLLQYQFIAVGQKAFQYLQKKKLPVANHFVQVGDFTQIEETRPISDTLVNGYLNHSWDEVITFGTHFRTALKQEVLSRRLFPVDFMKISETIKEIIPERGRFAEFINQLPATSYQLPVDYLIEPSPLEALAVLIPHLVTMQVYHLILEANASEHAARRAAMKNATDNAGELSQELTLEYNKSRQTQITKEIIEIVSGAEALR